MAALVGAISGYAKRRRPGFLIVPQNGEELLRIADYRRVVDGIGKEDLVYGVKGDGLPNGAEEIKRGIDDLNLARAAGHPVFVVEYISDPTKRAAVQRQLASRGFIVHFALRDLRHVPE